MEKKAASEVEGVNAATCLTAVSSEESDSITTPVEEEEVKVTLVSSGMFGAVLERR